MKKSLLTILAVCAIVVTAALAGCTKNNSLPGQSQLIVGKWTMKSAIGKYTFQGNTIKDTTRFTSADYFDFKADGTVSTMETGEAHTGNWKIVNNKLLFTNTNYVDYATGFDITKLTSTDLQLHYAETINGADLDQILTLSK
jgi:hypothetical protein